MTTATLPNTEATIIAHMPAPRRWPTMVALVCAFVAGIGVGMGVMMNMSDKGQFKTSQEVRKEFAEQLRSRLQLSPEQDQRITAIVDQSNEDFDDFRREVHPRVRAIFDKMEADIAAELRADQQPGFREVMDERHRRFPPPPEKKQP